MSEKLKVLIVDDEKLVRQGMITIMPWGEHNMEVVGDVNSGEKALEFLQRERADLLITDLAMPVMSGLELIRQVKALYPGVWIVVLTFHQDFDLVQEALRLGVIDYILKTQLEKEQMGDVLTRINLRIENDKRLMQGRPRAAHGSDGFRNRNALLLIHGDERMPLLRLGDDNAFSQYAVLETDCGALLLDGYESEREGAEAAAALIKRFPGASVVKVRNIGGSDAKAVLKFLNTYCSLSFFYQYRRGTDVYETDPAEGKAPEPPPPSADQDLKERWSSFQWVHDDEAFRALLAATESLGLEPARLANVMYSSAREWSRALALIDSQYAIARPEQKQYWCDWKEWLMETREFLQEKTRRESYSREIAASVMKALDIINRASEPDIKQESVARQVCMSRGYFSQCFKDITGKSFNDYVRNLRIEKAKMLLDQTNKPVYWIAEQIGYMDEKHFSRVFHEQTGMLPTEYRGKTR